MALEFKHTNATLYYGMSAFMRLFAERGAEDVCSDLAEAQRYRDGLRVTAEMILGILGLPKGLDTSAIDAKLREVAPEAWRHSYEVACGISWFTEALASVECTGAAYNRWCYEGQTSPRAVLNRGCYTFPSSIVDDDKLWEAIAAGTYPVISEGRLMSDPQVGTMPYLSFGYTAIDMRPVVAALEDPSLYPWQVLAVGASLDTDFFALPWAAELPAIPDHFARMSIKNPGMVSFYENEAKARAGRRLLMKPGRYLTKFYPDLSKDAVREWASKADLGMKLQFADTSDEIVRVYENGPNSCMSHPADDYSSPCHPCAAYESPDLKLAYIEDGGKITARCLVWPEKMIHSRIYGDTIRMRLLLAAAGYRTDYGPEGDYGDLSGARLKLIKGSGGRVVAPYIDGVGCAHISGGYLVIGRGKHYSDNIGCDSTNGWAFGGGHDEDEEEQVYVTDLDEDRDESWVHAHCHYDDIHDEWNRNATRVVTYLSNNGEVTDYTYFADETISLNAYLCPLNDTWYYDAIDAEEVAMADSEETVPVPSALLEKLGVVQHNGVYVTAEYAKVLQERELAEPELPLDKAA